MRTKNIKGFSNIAKIAFASLAFSLCLFFAIGLPIAKAQIAGSSNGFLDQIMSLYLQIKLDSIAEQDVSSNSNGEIPKPLGTNQSKTDVVIVEKTIDYNDMTTTGATVINPVIGDWYLDNLIMETNTYSMASGTLFQVVSSGDTYGTSTLVYSSDVKCFPKATTADLNSRITIFDDASCAGQASSTQRVVLSDGAGLVAKCTTLNCLSEPYGNNSSSTGYMKFTGILRPLQSYGAIFD